MKLKKIMLILCAGVMASMTCLNQSLVYANEGILFSNVKELLYVDFNDSVLDKSGNGNNGTLKNATYTTGIGGNGNKALSIHNDDDKAEGNKNPDQYVDFSSSITLGTSDYAISFWWKNDRSTTVSGDSGGTIIGNKNYNSGSNHGFAIGSFTNDIRVNFNADNARKEHRVTSFIDRQWHHIVVNYDRDANMVTYVDGNQVGSSDIRDQVQKSIDDLNLVIGADGNHQNGLSGGYYDDLHIYQGLLNQQEITSLYDVYKDALQEDENTTLRQQFLSEKDTISALLTNTNYHEEDIKTLRSHTETIMKNDGKNQSEAELNQMIATLEDEIALITLKKSFRDEIHECIQAYDQGEADANKKDVLKKALTLAQSFDLNSANSKNVTKQKITLHRALLLYRLQDDRLMSFAVMSDTHVGSRNDTNSNYLKAALQDIKQIEPMINTVLIAGDLTQNGTKAEYSNFSNLMKAEWLDDGANLVAVQGNHDVRWLCGSVNNGPTASSSVCGVDDNFITRYLPFKNEYLDTNEDSDTKNKLYYDTWIEGYHFVSLNTELDLKDQSYISDEQLAWLDQTLAENAESGKPIFLTHHQPLNDTHARSTYWSIGEQNDKLKNILAKYPQVILFSGHIHNGIGVAGAVNNGYGTMVDVPSLAQNENGLRQLQIGYIINVYEDFTQIRVYDYKHNKYLDDYEMIIDKSSRDASTTSRDLNTEDMNATTTSQIEDHTINSVLDNDQTTYWRTNTMNETSITIDLNGAHWIDGLRYLPYQQYRTDGSGGWKGHDIPGIIDAHQIEISTDDGLTWTKVEESTWQTNNYWKYASFTRTLATHIRLTSINSPSYNINTFLSAAELRPTGIDIDVSEYQTLVNQAEAIIEKEYTSESYQTFITAYQHLKEVMLEARTTKETAIKAMQDVQYALRSLIRENANAKAELKQGMDHAKQVIESDSFKRASAMMQVYILKQYEVVVALYYVENATSMDCENANELLTIELTYLILENIVMDSEQIVLEQYQEGVETFKQVLLEAKQVLQNHDKHQNIIQLSINNLKTAIAGLKVTKVPDDPKPDEPEIKPTLPSESDQQSNLKQRTLISEDGKISVSGMLSENVMMQAKQLYEADYQNAAAYLKASYSSYFIEKIVKISFANIQSDNYTDMIARIMIDPSLQTKKCIVVRIGDDGTLTELTSTINNNEIEFTITEGSTYAVLSKSKVVTVNTGDDTSMYMLYVMIMIGGFVSLMQWKQRNHKELA